MIQMLLTARDFEQISTDFTRTLREILDQYSETFGGIDMRKLKIDRVIYNGPATIVFWNDGAKTVVKCSENDVYDAEKGLAMAVVKRVYGSNFKKLFKNLVAERYGNEPCQE